MTVTSVSGSETTTKGVTSPDKPHTAASLAREARSYIAQAKKLERDARRKRAAFEEHSRAVARYLAAHKVFFDLDDEIAKVAGVR